MKTLTTLIKLHKRKVDMLRRQKETLEEERQQLIELSEKLAAELLHEMGLIAQDAKLSGFFGGYSARIKERQDGIAKEVVRLDSEITAKVDEIREEFSEQKKYEIALEHAKKRAEEDLKHKSQQRLDEIAIQQYQKNL